MAPIKSKRLIVLVAVLNVAVLCLLGHGVFRFRAERNALDQEMTQQGKKTDLLQKKAAEEKSRLGGLLRAKAALEGQLGGLQQEAAKLRRENATLLEANRTLEAERSAGLDGLREKLESLREEHRRLVAESRKREEETKARVASLEEENQGLKVSLEGDRQRLERCAASNAEFCRVTEELLSKYQDKGVVGALLQQEPLTQVKKVELEKMIRDYRDRASSLSVASSLAAELQP